MNPLPFYYVSSTLLNWVYESHVILIFCLMNVKGSWNEKSLLVVKTSQIKQQQQSTFNIGIISIFSRLLNYFID